MKDSLHASTCQENFYLLSGSDACMFLVVGKNSVFHVCGCLHNSYIFGSSGTVRGLLAKLNINRTEVASPLKIMPRAPGGTSRPSSAWSKARLFSGMTLEIEN